MQIYETDRIDIRAKYDLVTSKTEADVYSKVEGKQEVLVGRILEESNGCWKLWLVSDRFNKEYVVDDYEKLKPEFVEYANMWKERAKRGKC